MLLFVKVKDLAESTLAVSLLKRENEMAGPAEEVYSKPIQYFS